MPQMSPLMWSILFVLFSSMLLMTYIKMYFISNKKQSMNKTAIISTSWKNMNWAW